MKKRLIPLYREQERYTLFYDQHNNRLYKFQHRNKSFAIFFMVILVITYGSKFLDGIYQGYQTTFLNIILFIIALGVTYYVTTEFYSAYYLKETKQGIILDKYNLQECAIKGTKQLRIELYSAIISLPVGITFFIIFFATSKIRPLVIGCICAGVIFILILMRPLDRKRALRGFRNKVIDIE
ncbi:hypothetical protein ABRT01_17925 [Lentibacillus sp. L22]|uniref:hypothetical protein n=1 Tax=Lentibacillus TaxID=175304 RepID=UPI0022B17FF3|nr:hypothetical protein [Lentibacillus daqui]